MIGIITYFYPKELRISFAGIKLNEKIKFETFLIGKLVDLVLLDEKIVKKTDWYKWMNFKERATDLLETGKFPNT